MQLYILFDAHSLVDIKFPNIFMSEQCCEMSDQLLFWSDILAGQVHFLSHALTLHICTFNSMDSSDKDQLPMEPNSKDQKDNDQEAEDTLFLSHQDLFC